MAEELRSFALDIKLDTNKQTYTATWDFADGLDLDDLPGALREWLLAGGWIDDEYDGHIVEGVRVFEASGATFTLEASPTRSVVTLTEYELDRIKEHAYKRGFEDGVEMPVVPDESWRERAALIISRATRWIR